MFEQFYVDPQYQVKLRKDVAARQEFVFYFSHFFSLSKTQLLKKLYENSMIGKFNKPNCDALSEIFIKRLTLNKRWSDGMTATSNIKSAFILIMMVSITLVVSDRSYNFIGFPSRPRYFAQLILNFEVPSWSRCLGACNEQKQQGLLAILPPWPTIAGRA